MIYEVMVKCVDDLMARWTDVRDGSQVLSNALTNDPTSKGIVGGWVTGPISTAIGDIQTQHPSLEHHPALSTLMTVATNIFNTSNAQFASISASASALLPGLFVSTDGQVAAAARILQSRLTDLGGLIDECLQEILEIADTTNTGARSNLAGLRGSVDDISTYPVLTREFGYPAPSSYPSTGGGGASGGTVALGRMVEQAVTEVLGRRPRVADTKSFVAALTQSFTCTEVEGHSVCTWTPRGAIGQTELGATITGAQASLYQRAKVALDNALPLLDKLTPLRPDADLQEVEAVRSIIRTEFIEVVNELGVEGGPRVQRVDDLFDVLIDPASDNRRQRPQRRGFGILGTGTNILASPNLLEELCSGEIGRLGDVFGLTRDRVNTIEEEQNLTNLVILRDYVDSLYDSWLEFRPSFLGGADNFFGTQLVLLQRALSVVAESVSEVAFAMDSVFLGPAERQTVRIDFPAPTPPMLVEELLSWVQTYASEEGPRIIQDAGKRGARPVVSSTLERLHDLVRTADGRIRHPAARHPRVRRTLGELAAQLDDAARLAGTIR